MGKRDLPLGHLAEVGILASGRFAPEAANCIPTAWAALPDVTGQ
jgi:hypothetical protein